LEYQPLDSVIQTHEAAIRLGFFVGIFALVAIWEVRAPRRARTLTRLQRWTSNLGLVAVLNTVLLRILFPAAAVGMALFTSAQGWGLLNAIELPYWLAVLVAVVVLDFVIWVQHVLFHAVPRCGGCTGSITPTWTTT
jgi:sterol desaturase/sphingolipid hydroxylase (fatty acid hydroxylase superfamily)